MKTTLVIGGARSGKSRFAQELGRQLGDDVLFVATAVAGDEEMKRRIDQHKKERPPGWQTLEVTTGIGPCIEREIGTARVVIVDCITLLVNNILSKPGFAASEETDACILERELQDEINGLVQCIKKVPADFIIVSNEVGLGLVPANELGRLYRDLLGKANQKLAECADEVYLMVAGLPLRIKG